MEFGLGTPTVTLHAIMDTGSDLVWVQCEPCSSCYKQEGPIFTPNQSSSYKVSSCHSKICNDAFGQCEGKVCNYYYEYDDLSRSMGNLASEVITMEDTSGVQRRLGRIVFGCGNDNEGDFGKAAGIVGLARGPASLITQMPSVLQRRFSYCITSFYYVSVEDISINGTPLQTQGGSVGQLQTEVYLTLATKMEQLISLPKIDGTQVGLDLCFHYGGGANITVCLAMYAEDDFSIIGNIQQQNFQMSYDVAKMQLSFKPTTC